MKKILEIENMTADDLKQIIFETIREVLSQQEADKQPEANDLLTVKQALELLHISPATLAKWKKEGRVPFQRLGKRVYFSKSDLLNSTKRIGDK